MVIFRYQRMWLKNTSINFNSTNTSNKKAGVTRLFYCFIVVKLFYCAGAAGAGAGAVAGAGP